MIAGLASQVVSLVLFMGLCGEFAYRVWKNPYRWSIGDVRMREVRGGGLWRGFLGGEYIYTLITFSFRIVFSCVWGVVHG